MPFDRQAIFANLTEKERVFGHHSAEGRAIRTLGRALDGWSAGDLSARDAIVLCDQAMEDWLKAKVEKSAWSAASLALLLDAALDQGLLTSSERARLQTVHDWRLYATAIATADVEAALEWCIKIVEKRWS
jgi:hypothetical protein